MRRLRQIAAVALLLLSYTAHGKVITNFEETFHTSNNEIRYKPKAKFRRTIYVDAAEGNDSSSGHSTQSAIKTLSRLSQMKPTSGDQVLLRGGQTHYGTIELVDIVKGGDMLHISSYGNEKATLNFSGYPAGVSIKSSSNIVVSDLRITANGTPEGEKYMLREADAKTRDRVGVHIVNAWYDPKQPKPASRDMENITIYNIDFYDIFYYNEGDENIPTNRPCRSWSEPSINYGYGIVGYNQAHNTAIEGLLVDNCTVRNVSNIGVRLTGSKNNIFNNVKLTGCNFHRTGGPGYMFANCNNGVLENSKTYYSGSSDDTRKWGRGSGMWLMNCDGFLIERNHFEGAAGIGDSCGAHIDHGNRNVIIQNCFSKNNAGGFVEILGKNRNCSYRYNISVDDGWRNSKKKDPAQSEAHWSGTTALTLGTLVSVSGYTGRDFIGPYQVYIYNNTVVNTRERKDGFINPFVFQITTSSVGVYVANNIFYVPQQMYAGWSEHIKSKDGEKMIVEKAFDFRKAYKDGDNLAIRDMTSGEIEAMDVVIENNLYKLYDPKFPHAENAITLSKDANGRQFGYLDRGALGGDPQFVNINGECAEDFVPMASEIIERGVEIRKLSTDETSYGLSTFSSDIAKGMPLNLEVKRDFFGRKIRRPIVGASVPIKQ